MLSDLKFLTAAVARRDFVEELCHFHIWQGHAYAFDGMMSMHTKCNIDINVRPHASAFIRAIAACDDEGAVAMHLTDAGRLSIRSGSFRAFVQCLDTYKEGLPIPKPEGKDVSLTDELLESIKVLAPFMSIDASRPWAQGLLLAGDSTYATNNIILAQRWHGANFPYQVIIPADFVKAVIKIGEAPIRAQVTESSLTFHFEDDRWLRTQLLVGEWPAKVNEIFKDSPVAKPLPDEFFPALDQLKPFIDDMGRVYIFPDRLSTSNAEGVGASVDVATGLTESLFHLEQLRLLQPVLTKIDLTAYPAPAPWFGNKLRGVIVGQRF